MAFFDFLTNVPRNDSGNVVDYDALQKARKDLIGELDAVIQYDDHIHTSNVEAAKATWVDIRNEELVHVGELLGLILYLAPYQRKFVEDGLKEFDERLGKQNSQT